ncbi:histone H1 [Bacteroidales bacterium]|nr:histone H1 [Bacteroidales bacterium]
MNNLLKKIQEEIETFSKESCLQVEKANKAAGTRARKSALELSKMLKDFRKVSVEASKKPDA